MKLAREAGTALADRVHSREAQVRRLFIARDSGLDPVPPMTAMLRGGRGGAVRLKLYLSLLWAGAGAPHDVTFPARSWAQLLGLPDPDGAGARRIRDAIDWLEENGFVVVTRNAGLPSTITLYEESGQRRPYSLPGPGARKASQRGRVVRRHLYVRLPPELWTNGWVAQLSGAATAMLLVLLAEERGKPGEVWLSPRLATERYALAAETRSKGLRELVAAGLATSRKRTVATTAFEFQRTRNVYRLRLSALTEKEN